MNLEQIIKYFYLIYSFYAVTLIDLTSITLVEIFLALVLMWTNYIAFAAGMGKKKNSIYKKKSPKNIWILKKNKKILFLVALISLLSSYFSVKYYTGQTPFSLYRSLSNGISVYYEYQNFFKEQQRNLFSISKIPFIFMLYIVKIIFFYSFLSFFKFAQKIPIHAKLFLTVVSFSYLYIGISRGTNFEFFELIFLIIFIFLSRKKINFKNLMKKNMQIGLLIVMMIYLYQSRIEARGVKFGRYISSDVFYNEQSIINSISEKIATLLLSIYGYFGFGFFYTGRFITEVWFKSFENTISSILPLGFKVITNRTSTQLVKEIVDIGAKWNPDTVVIIGNVGYLGLIILCFGLGVIVKKIYKIKNRNCMDEMCLFFILLFMFSLPIGNFITASSSNILIVLTLVIYKLSKIILKNPLLKRRL